MDVAFCDTGSSKEHTASSQSHSEQQSTSVLSRSRPVDHRIAPGASQTQANCPRGLAHHPCCPWGPWAASSGTKTPCNAIFVRKKCTSDKTSEMSTKKGLPRPTRHHRRALWTFQGQFPTTPIHVSHFSPKVRVFEGTWFLMAPSK